MGKRKNTLTVIARVLPDGQAMTIDGRPAWALLELHRAGPEGCTPYHNPAPRWSHYVYQLRGLGFAVETITESHGGQFAGHHARYVLRSRISLVVKSDQDGKRAAA